MSQDNLPEQRPRSASAPHSAAEMGPAPAGPAWHTLTVEEAQSALQADVAAGLSRDEALRRRERFGRNELEEGRRVHPAIKLLHQFTEPLIIVLIAAAVVSGVVGEISDAVVIAIILLANGVIGFVQEYRADQAMAALRKLTVPRVRLRRDGRMVEVSAVDVVPGDIVLLQAGDSVPADGRVIESADLRIEEAVLTGESLPVDKIDAPLQEADPPLGDRRNMAYKGTVVVYGRGELLATATAMDTEVGKIAASLATTGDTATPLQRRLGQLGTYLAVGALAICALVFGLGLLRGIPPMEMLLTAVALAVAAIPEGLPAVVTIALALGAGRMARRNALMRSLPAVEGLGSVTTICSDKTGTLTRNQMTVTDIVVGGARWRVTDTGIEPEQVGALAGDLPEHLVELLRAGVLCNDAELRGPDESEGAKTAIGDPTETALLALAVKAGLQPEDLLAGRPRVAENPFDSERKRMATLHSHGDAQVVYAKGSPEAVLEVCTEAYWDKEEQELTESLREAIVRVTADMARRGQRVLALARRHVRDISTSDTPDLEHELTLLGLVGIIDPARPEAKSAIAECRSAGIRTIMITGDHSLTAQAISADLGLAPADAEVLTGVDLARLSDEELKERAERVSVYARVSPEHKLRLVNALQRRGHVVAMTGDGVNDAPALKKADIGVSMGITGTDVAREASKLVLADDNFATIVAAVREGRVIYDNIRKFLRFLLTSNISEIMVMVVALAAGWPMPLTALQILWINLVTDGLPALALGIEPPESSVMQRPPRNPAESIFGDGMLGRIFLGGAVMTALVILVMRRGEIGEHQHTMAFTALALAQMANCFAVRSERDLIIRVGLLRNPHLVGAVLLTVASQMLVVYVPALQKVFKTVALSPVDMGLCFAAAAMVFVVIELNKLLTAALARRRAVRS